MSYAHQIEVFSIKPLSVQTEGIDATVCYLDELELVEAELSDKPQGLISEIIQEKEDGLMRAMQCQYKARLYQIEKLPAIVIDNEYVAYGTDSVSKALRLFKGRGEANA